MRDVFGDSITIVDFESPTQDLLIESWLKLERYPFARFEKALPGVSASTYPFLYERRADRSRTPRRAALSRQWRAPGLGCSRSSATCRRPLGLFNRVNEAIHGFLYVERDERGARGIRPRRSPAAAPAAIAALLFIEAARELNIAAAVTGYLHDPQLDTGVSSNIQSSASTHAWAEIYLPGTGWLEYDPTNGLLGSEHLVRVAAVRDPRQQAVPISGSFVGPRGSFIAMDVEVSVRAVE